MDLRVTLSGVLLIVFLLEVEDASAKKNWADYYAKRFKLNSSVLQKSLPQSRRASRMGQTFKRDMGGSRVARRIQPRVPSTVEVAGHTLPNLKEHIKKPWSTTSIERQTWPKHINLDLARRPWMMKRYESPQNLKYRPWSNVHDNLWHQTQIKRLQEQKTRQPAFEARPARRVTPWTIKIPQVLPEPMELRLPLIPSELRSQPQYQVRPAVEYVFKPPSQVQDEPIKENLSEDTGVLTLVEKSAENKETGTNETRYFEYINESLGEKTIISSASVERKQTDQGLIATILVEDSSSDNHTDINEEASELRLPPSQIQAALRPEPVVYNVDPRKPIILSPPQEIPVNVRPPSEYQYLERQPEAFQAKPSEVENKSTLHPDSLELITEFEENVGDEMVKTKQFEYMNGDMRETKIIASVSATKTHVDQGLVSKVIIENPPLPLVRNETDNSIAYDAQPALRPDSLILRVPQILPQPQEISQIESTSGPVFFEGPKTDFVAAPVFPEELNDNAPDNLQLIEVIDEEDNKTKLYEYNNKGASDEHIIISSVSIQRPNNDQGILSKIVINKPAIPLTVKNISDNIEASHLTLPENNGFENSQPGYSSGIISYQTGNVQSLSHSANSPKPKFRYAAQRPEEFIPRPESIVGPIVSNDNGLKLIETFDVDNGYDMNTTNLFEFNKEREGEGMVISSVSVQRPNINQGVKASIIISNSTSENEFSNDVNEPLGIQSLPQPELRTIPNPRPSLPVGYLMQRPTGYVSLESMQSDTDENIIKAAEAKLLQSKNDTKPVYLLGKPTMYQPLVGNTDESATEKSSKPFSYVGHSYEGDIISKNTNNDPYISSGIIDILNDPLPLVESNPLLGDIAAAYSDLSEAFAQTYHVQVHEVDEIP